MKILKLTAFIGVLIFGATTSYSQLSNGTIAPNFTLNDINGNSHTLYDYLDQGKTVYVDFFAVHCPYCWNYSNTNALSNLYDQYGPGTASDDVFVMAIEYDPNNTSAPFYGNGPGTQGNWVAGKNYPFINPEGTDRAILSVYDVVYYPMIYAICPDRTLTLIGTQSTSTLYNHVSSCASILGVNEELTPSYWEIGNSNLFLSIQLNQFSENSVNEIEIYSIHGELIERYSLENADLVIDIQGFKSGIYFLSLKKDGQQLISEKIIKF